MGNNKIVVIGHNLKDRSEIYTCLASGNIEVIVVDDVDKARELLLGIPPAPMKSMIIQAPAIVERNFEDYKTGQEKRRERRAKRGHF